MPEIADAELCVLIEGKPDVVGATGTIRINGRPARVGVRTSAGQFGAAVDASPENWTWLVVPLNAGDNDVDVTLNIPVDGAAVGVFVRGSVSAHHDEATGDEPAFPVFQPTRRPWSQTIQSLKAFVTRAPETPST
jgi:hypothetical protein